MLVGRYDAAGGSVDTGPDPIAFAATVETATGIIYLAQWTSLDHGTEATGLGNPSYDEAVTFESGTVTLTASVVDFDQRPRRSRQP